MLVKARTEKYPENRGAFLLRGAEQRRKFMLSYEFRFEEILAHQENCHLCGSKRVLNFLPPLRSGFDLGIVPDSNDALLDRRGHHRIEFVELLFIFVTITDEDPFSRICVLMLRRRPSKSSFE